VTCFITRHAGNATELLLFNHPHVGVQIPAGTVNQDEDLESAARRAAAEEGRLDKLVLVRKLNQIDDPPSEGINLTVCPTTVYSHPELHSID
jgi:8-oxo-dGTP pyrophosphatase MutT (NUDIX family)